MADDEFDLKQVLKLYRSLIQNKITRGQIQCKSAAK